MIVRMGMEIAEVRLIDRERGGGRWELGQVVDVDVRCEI